MKRPANPRIGLLLLLWLMPGAAFGGAAPLARTPPMGWNSWNRFRLDISDAAIRAQAAAMATNGMKAAGYEYVVIDGGWEGQHDAAGVFHPDAQKFPDMKGLCDYVHGLGQMWRTTSDIGDNYFNMLVIGFGQNGLEPFAGPGHWNDPDCLEVGNGKMKDEEYRTQMTLWCILAAPLFAGNDLTQMSPATLETLTSPEVIAVDQDPAGRQGYRVRQEGPLEVWMKPLSDGSKAVALFSRHGRTMELTVDFKDVGLAESALVRDLWQRKDLGTFNHSFTATLPRHGAVLLKVTSPPSAPGGKTSAPPAAH